MRRESVTPGRSRIMDPRRSVVVQSSRMFKPKESEMSLPGVEGAFRRLEDTQPEMAVYENGESPGLVGRSEEYIKMVEKTKRRDTLRTMKEEEKNRMQKLLCYDIKEDLQCLDHAMHNLDNT